MPIYEYACAGCAHEFEVILQPSDKASCPKCGGTKLNKQFSVFAVGSEKSAAAPMPPSCQDCGDRGGKRSCPF